MRILHTSDWHLGRSLHGQDLSTCHEAYLDHLVEVVDNEGIDAVLVAGDVYDRAIPPVTAVEMLGDALERLASRVPVVVTPGNHDSAPRLGFGSGLFRDRLHVRARLADAWTPVVLHDRGGRPTHVYGLPWLEPDFVRHHLVADDGHVPERSHEAVTSAVMDRVRADIAARRRVERAPVVVMAHAFVSSVQVEPTRSESERDIRVGGVDLVPSRVFGHGDDAPHYVALGHLHRAQRVHRDDHPGPRMHYSGSPVAFSFSERHDTKASLVVDLHCGASPSVTAVAAPVVRRVSEVSGTLEELLSGAHDEVADHWLKVTVRQPSRPLDLHTVLRRRFPHLLVALFEATGDAGRGPAAVRDADDPMSVMDGFVRYVGGSDPSTDEHAALLAAYDAVLTSGRCA